MQYIGIDPGLNGAIAIIYNTGHYSTSDIPVLEIKNKKSTKRRYNAVEVLNIINKFVSFDTHTEIWIENVHAMPGQGVTSMFNMGRGFGMYEGILHSIAVFHKCFSTISINYISPITWKKRVMDGMGKEKDASVYKALQLFPNAQLYTPRGKALDGRAEALLIAYYGKTFNAKKG